MIDRWMVVLAASLLVSGAVAGDDPVPLPADCPAIGAVRKVVKPSPCGFQCGTDRWPVKTLTDRDVDRIDFTVRSATIERLGRLTVPKRRLGDRRAGRAERQVFCVDAFVVDLPSSQADGDLHLQLVDPTDTTATMIAEFPDIGCATVCSSRFAPAISRARNSMERALATWNSDTLRVRIVGVGFFDRNHGQVGAAPNYFELHPVLAVAFP